MIPEENSHEKLAVSGRESNGKARKSGCPHVIPMLYASFVLEMTLWCTLLILYRILTVTRVKRGAVGRLRVYRRFIEVLVEY